MVIVHSYCSSGTHQIPQGSGIAHITQYVQYTPTDKFYEVPPHREVFFEVKYSKSKIQLLLSFQANVVVFDLKIGVA